jgi:3-dehydroquinate synthase
MTTIRIGSSLGTYEVQCANGALARARTMLAKLGDATGVFVLSSPRVWRNWGKQVASALGVTRAERVILFDDSEKAKRLQTVEGITRALVKAGADRRSLIVAVGGGVVGDVGGFAAASYQRGVRLAHIPTTVVAQVDSSIGGKTGVDLPEGKNLVGAFYPPKLVVADPNLLDAAAQGVSVRPLRSGEVRRDCRSGAFCFLREKAAGDFAARPSGDGLADSAVDSDQGVRGGKR